MARKNKIQSKGVIINPFTISTTKPMAFVNELERLCKKFASQHSDIENYPNQQDYYFNFKIGDVWKHYW